MLKSVFNRLAQGKLQQLRIFQQLFEQANCFGVIISVRNSLIYRKAEIYAVAHFKRAVLIEKGLFFLSPTTQNMEQVPQLVRW